MVPALLLLRTGVVHRAPQMRRDCAGDGREGVDHQHLLPSPQGENARTLAGSLNRG